MSAATDCVREMFSRKEKGEKPRLLPFLGQSGTLLLGGGNDVLCSLGDTELHHGLCFDLDGLARLRVAADSGFALRLHQAADTGNDEDAVLLGFLDRSLGKQIEKRGRLLVGQLELLGQVPGKSSLGKSSCHVCSPSRVCCLGFRRSASSEKV